MEHPRQKIAIVTNIAWNIYNFRKDLVCAIKEAGYEPVMMAAHDKYADQLKEEGWTFIPLKNLERTGINPLKDLFLLFDLIKIYKAHSIKCALHYTAKPLVYASLSASFLKIPYIPTITGLAGPFSGNRRIIRKIVTLLYRFSLRSSHKIIFQNTEDRNFFLAKKITELQKTIIVNGSGIDLDKFRCGLYDSPPKDKIVFLMCSRLSKAKGVEYYVNAARHIRKKYPHTLFRLAGPFDSDKLAICKKEVEKWQKEGIIEYIGVSDSVEKEISKAHVIVYPSYYMEGIPKSLIEAAAMSRPIITTDNVGCRDVVQNNVNGFLIPTKNSEILIETCERFIKMSDEERERFGTASRQIALEKFDGKKITRRYLDLIRGCVENKKQSEISNYEFLHVREVVCKGVEQKEDQVYK
jgi:glycosyltransferase involved in cell wall biosynthesis